MRNLLVLVMVFVVGCSTNAAPPASVEQDIGAQATEDCGALPAHFDAAGTSIGDEGALISMSRAQWSAATSEIDALRTWSECVAAHQ